MAISEPLPARDDTDEADGTGDTGDGPDTSASRPAPAPSTPPAASRRLRDLGPLLMVRAAHPRQAVLTALGLAVAAGLSGRPDREIGLVLATVLVGQVVMGWHNDLVDAETDLRHERSGKPVSDGRIDAGSLWFALCCAVLVLIPLAISNGLVAGCCYLASVVVGCLANVALRRGLLSVVPWAAAFALYPAFLSYGGFGGAHTGAAPEPLMVALAAALGVGVHLLVSLWGLVADHADGWTYLPLKLGLRMGATRLLVFTVLYLAAVGAGLLWAASTVGLSR